MEFEYPVYEDAQAQPFFDFEAPKTSTDKNDDESAEPMKAFYCTQPGCKKSFRYRSEILRHMVTHTSKRPYVCTYKNCMKGFKRSDALATHMRIHTREKTFECPYGNCKSTFSTKAGLKYHTLKHKSEKHVANQGKHFVGMEQNVNTNEDLFLEMGDDSCFEASLESNFQEQYPMGENYYGYDSSFDNTQVQQIAPFQVCQEKNEFDTYLTNYSTPSNMSNSSESYHFTNGPQKVMSYAANLINSTEDFGSLSMTKVDSNDKLFAMMQTIFEENSNLKKRLDEYQRFMTRGPQYPAEEQNGIF